MSKKILLLMLCLIAIAFFAACSGVQSGNAKTTEVQIDSVNNQTNSFVTRNANANLKTVRVQPTSLRDGAASGTVKDCQPSKVPMSAGLLDKADINELSTKPGTKSEFK